MYIHYTVVQEKALHPINDPYLSTPAALVYVAHFVELIGWVLDQPLPFPLHRPVAIRYVYMGSYYDLRQVLAIFN